MYPLPKTRRAFSLLVLSPAFLLLAACEVPAVAGVVPASEAAFPSAASATAPLPSILPSETVDPFDAYLTPPHPVARGYGSPVGKGWRETADGWQGHGAVLAVAAGDLRGTDDGLTLRSVAYENHHQRVVEVTYSGVKRTAEEGPVAAGAVIGTAERLTVTARVDGETLPFRELLLRLTGLPDPTKEPSLALVSHEQYALRTYRNGVEAGRYAVSFGQAAGAKTRRGDNRTPKGMYFVVAKSTGPFDGPFGAYYGGHWTKIDYPNAWDAARGVDEGLITLEEQRAITTAWRKRQSTLQATKLGGGIGFHGWAEEWPDEGARHLSWGCVVVHLSDVAKVYAETPVGTMVVLF